MKTPPSSTADLARMLGLSRWTVSRVLNGHAGVHPKTVRRVLDAVQNERFTPSILGRGLRGGKTHLIGLCLPNLEDYFLTAKIMRLQTAIVQRGLHPVIQIAEGEGEETRALEHFTATRCAGVIMIASRLSAESPALRQLETARIPVVHVDPLFSHARAKVVATDRASAMRQVIVHLHEQGHRYVVIAGIDISNRYGKQRLEGLRAGCRDCGWDFEDSLTFLSGSPLSDDFSLGAELGRELLALKSLRATAVITANDRVAFGLAGILGETQLGRLALVGYDNTEMAAHLRPALTSVDPQVDQLIDLSVGLLLDPPGKKNRRFVKPRLVVRETTLHRVDRIRI